MYTSWYQLSFNSGGPYSFCNFTLSKERPFFKNICRPNVITNLFRDEKILLFAILIFNPDPRNGLSTRYTRNRGNMNRLHIEGDGVHYKNYFDITLDQH